MIGHVRTLSLDLRPPLLDELGLVPALRGYLEAQARRTRIDIDLDAPHDAAGIDAAVEITAFRVVQEAVTNVIRHARASHVHVQLTRNNGSLEVSVKDDGEGFDVNELQEHHPDGEHLGLLGIRERVESIGGQVVISSSPDRGTEIKARVPLAA